MKILLLLLSLILMIPVLSQLILKISSQNKTLSPLYIHLSLIFIFAIFLSQWIMLPFYVTKKIAGGFLIFSLSYLICQLKNWNTLGYLMLGIMLSFTIFLFALNIYLA